MCPCIGSSTQQSIHWNTYADTSTSCELVGHLVLSTGDLPDSEEKIIFAVTLIITDLVVFALLAHTWHFINKCVMWREHHHTHHSHTHVFSEALKTEVAEHTQSLKLLFISQRWLCLGQGQLYACNTPKLKEGIWLHNPLHRGKGTKEDCRQHTGYQNPIVLSWWGNDWEGEGFSLEYQPVLLLT